MASYTCTQGTFTGTWAVFYIPVLLEHILAHELYTCRLGTYTGTWTIYLYSLGTYTGTWTIYLYSLGTYTGTWTKYLYSLGTYTGTWIIYLCSRYIYWYMSWVWRFYIKKEEYGRDEQLHLIRKLMGVSQGQFDNMEVKYFITRLEIQLNLETTFSQ